MHLYASLTWTREGRAGGLPQIHRRRLTLFESGRSSGVSWAVLSIDIDNNDYWVWQAIDVVKPRVVVIEYNATLRPPFSGVVPYEPTKRWDGSNYFGASLDALARLGRRKGYGLVGCSFNGANAALFLLALEGGALGAAQALRAGLGLGAASLSAARPD